MGLFDFLGNVIKPVTNLIDDLHTSEEEKQQLQNEVTKIENAVASEILEYETKLMEAQSKVITAEAQGDSWLQKSWRPITMLVFLVLVVFDSFGWLASPLAEEAWILLQIGLGGYVIGRSAEKVGHKVVSAMKEKG